MPYKNGQLSRTGAGVASAVIAAVALLAAGALAFVRRGRIRNRHHPRHNPLKD